MNSNKERLKGLSSIVARFMVLGAVAAVAGWELHEDYSGSQQTTDPILKISPVSALPSAQASKEQLREIVRPEADELTLESVLSFMASSGNQILADASLILSEMDSNKLLLIEPGDWPSQLPHVTLISVGERSSHFVILVDENFLKRDDVGEADVAAHLVTQLIVWGQMKNWQGEARSDFFWQRQKLEEDAWRKVVAQTFFTPLRTQVRSREVRDRFASFGGKTIY